MRKAGGVEHVRIMEDRYGRSLVGQLAVGNEATDSLSQALDGGLVGVLLMDKY